MLFKLNLHNNHEEKKLKILGKLEVKRMLIQLK